MDVDMRLLDLGSDTLDPYISKVRVHLSKGNPLIFQGFHGGTVDHLRLLPLSNVRARPLTCIQQHGKPIRFVFSNNLERATKKEKKTLLLQHQSCALLST